MVKREAVGRGGALLRPADGSCSAENLGRNSNALAYSIVGADDSVRPQIALFLRKFSANSRNIFEPTESSPHRMLHRFVIAIGRQSPAPTNCVWLLLLFCGLGYPEGTAASSASFACWMVMLLRASENSSWMTACGKLTEQDARFPRSAASRPASASSCCRVSRFRPPPRQWNTNGVCFFAVLAQAAFPAPPAS